MKDILTNAGIIGAILAIAHTFIKEYSPNAMSQARLNNAQARLLELEAKEKEAHPNQ